MAINYTTSFNINVDDLNYILKQIMIAEASSIGYNANPLSILDSIIAAYGGDANSAALLPAGLRTVDGTFNNLRVAPTATDPGTSQYGAADTLFPRLTDPVFRNVNGPGIDFNGDGLVDVINHNYGDTNGAAPGGIRSVADVDPRTISNLIVDMSVNNPAAIAAYLGNPLSLDQFAVDHPGMNPVAPGGVVNPLVDLEITNTDLQTLPNLSPDIGLSPGFNSWMTYFGQFFDHGLDLVTKGGNGTVYIPLAADDPLYDKGADGVANNIVQATNSLGEALWYVSDPGFTPVGAPPPATSTVVTGWAAMFNDDGAGADGVFGTADDRPNFMALTRAKVTFDANGVPQTTNTTTPWIDQNQTYTSNASHQVFLREYAFSVDTNSDNIKDSRAVSTGRLIDGTTASGSSNGAIGNWGEVKAQALTMLGIRLSDHDVNNVPLLLTDQYGKFIPGANGYAQVATTTGFVEGTAAGLDLSTLAGVVRTNHAFLDDIAHHAAPGFYDHDGNPGTPKIKQTADLDQDTNHNGKFDFVDGAGGRDGLYDVGVDTTTDILTDVNGDGEINTADFFAADYNIAGDPTSGLKNSTYDDEMLESHFITGDGRGNENIALSSVHSVFHSEHNRAVEVNKATLLAHAADASLNSADHTLAVAFLNEWLLTDVAADATAAQIAALTPADVTWDGERLFQAARFSTEMQYQHMVFEEFARRIQPAVDPFIFSNSAALDPTIVAEFAHTVYRFGHTMLTGTVDRLDANLDPLNPGDPLSVEGQQTLLAVFLNPQAYTAGGVDSATINANLIRGLSRDVGNAMDEFIVTDVRSSLLGLPLDLGALNIARGRDTGIPSLNETRAQLYNSTNLADLKPYENWADFAANIKNPASIINFIAAYGTHASITDQVETAPGSGIFRNKTMVELREAAALLVLGGVGEPADRFDFLGATGAYATPALGGMNDIDLWIGGLAEAHPEFGGMLGSTFNYVFEYQMESLQNGDRFYYLSRTQGLNILNQLEPNTFSDIVMRNTELGDIYSTHLNGFLFVTPDHFIELDRGIAQTDYNDTGAGIDPLWNPGETHSLLTPLKVTRSYVGATTTLDTETGITHDVGGSLKYIGGEHVVVGGTEGNDKIWTDKGIDTLWGDGGDDYLNAGTESDNVFGGAGDDIIEDPFGDDLLRGNQGNDVITSARGLDIFFGDQGQDYIVVGQDAGEVFAGQDNDFVLGGSGTDGLMGNEGDDWIEGGEGLDGISGENSQLFFNSTIVGHDVLNGQGNDTDYDGESGDDIMFQTAGITRSNGMFGFDWGIHKFDSSAVNSDLGIPIFATQLPFTLRDRFDSVEGLSGWVNDDILTGAAVFRGGAAGFGAGPGNPVDESDLKAKNVHLIDGLADLLGLSPAQLAALVAQELAEEAVAPTSLTAARSSSVISIAGGDEIILGGGGNDTIKGNLGNDILDGDAWLNVRIKIVHAGITYSAESMNTSTLISGPNAGKVFNTYTAADALVNPLHIEGSPNFASPAFGGASLTSLMLNRTLNPGDLSIVREILQSTTAATDVDTAVYNGNSADYSLVRNLDGTMTITHNLVVGGVTTINDGRDTLRNFEYLRFANKNVLLASAAATGSAFISDLSPTEGQSILANTSTIADANGLEAFNYQWQSTNDGVNWANITGATNATFVPVDLPGLLAGPQADLQLRAIVSFTDSAGYAESFTTAATGYVGTDWDGAGLADTFNGTRGDDIADGNGGADILNGNDGSDTLNGGAGTDTLNGGDGNDFLNGGADIDTLNGGNGNDRLDGGTGADIMAGGDGNDTYIVDTVPGDVIIEFANEGIDTVQTALTYNLAASGTTATVENLTLTGAGNVNGTGNALDNVLTGNTGNNVLDGGTGADTMIGGNGNDTYVVDNVGDTVNEIGSTGTDIVISSVDFTLNTAGAANVERLTLTGSATNATGNALNNTITGNASNNTIDGGVGADTMIGGNGNDTYVVDSTSDVVTETNLVGSGTDTVQSSATSFTLGTNVENLTLTGTGDINATGNNTANVITGNSGNNTLLGAAGNDSIVAGAGNDTVTGGVGADIITLGSGNDTVVLLTTTDSGLLATNVDTVTDFVTSLIDALNGDRIDVSAIDANMGLAGNDVFTFIGTGIFTAPGQLRYQQIGADTFVQGNVGGSTAADFSIQLSGLHVLGAADFVL
jgi:Ca2+-binding RTX toxin-like protein